jgi:tRNA (cmo5U34)-methyltransferase
MTGVLSEQYAQPGTCIYDIGCSLGESIRSAERALADNADANKTCRLIGIDSSSAMITRAREQSLQGSAIEWIQSDALLTQFETTSVVILNFTLQFIPIDERLRLLKAIRRAMAPGGLLILSEKLTMADPAMDALMIDLHHDFKRSQGYSDLEIAQKRDAIDNVLIPETAQIHTARLADAGFSRSSIWFQCLNFASFIAIA